MVIECHNFLSTSVFFFIHYTLSWRMIAKMRIVKNENLANYTKFTVIVFDCALNFTNIIEKLWIQLHLIISKTKMCVPVCLVGLKHISQQLWVTLIIAVTLIHSWRTKPVLYAIFCEWILWYMNGRWNTIVDMETFCPPRVHSWHGKFLPTQGSNTAPLNLIIGASLDHLGERANNN